MPVTEPEGKQWCGWERRGRGAEGLAEGQSQQKGRNRGCGHLGGGRHQEGEVVQVGTQAAGSKVWGLRRRGQAT